MRIERDNLIIRSAIVSDAEQLTEWWNDGAVMMHAGFPQGLGTIVEDTRQLITRNQKNHGQLCILEVNGFAIGEISYTIEQSMAEIGIKICNAGWQDQGLGTRFLKMLISFLFDEELTDQNLPIQNIILDTNLNNLRAQYVYEKLGFRKVRVNQYAWQDQVGEWQTSVDYELSRDDFLTR